MNELKFSLILATYERTSEVRNFLSHLNKQVYRDFELIIVDQNFDNRIASLLPSIQCWFPIIHIHSELGQSVSRNIGLRIATGDIITFPDDDCWYPDDLLFNIYSLFLKDGYIDGITIRIIDNDGNNYPNFSNNPGEIKALNVWGRGSAIGLFLRKQVIDTIGNFDESLGAAPSNKWVSSEDIDLIIRAVNQGFCIHYHPELTVFHPNPISKGYQTLLNRAYGYGAGRGHVWRKHHFPLWLVLYLLIRPFIGTIISTFSADFSKARYHWLSLLGRWTGWRSKS